MWFENAHDEMKYHVPFTGLNVPITTGSGGVMHNQYHFNFAFCMASLEIVCLSHQQTRIEMIGSSIRSCSGAPSNLACYQHYPSHTRLQVKYQDSIVWKAVTVNGRCMNTGMEGNDFGLRLDIP